MFESKIVLNQIDVKDGVSDICDGSGSKYHFGYLSNYQTMAMIKHYRCDT